MCRPILAAGVALHVVARPVVTTGRLLIGGTLMGAGIGAMHYTGMAAMRLDGLVRYDPTLFAASVVVAVVLAIVALKVRFWVSKDNGDGFSEWQEVVRRADPGLRRDGHALHGDGLDLLLCRRRAAAATRRARSLGVFAAVIDLDRRPASC